MKRLPVLLVVLIGAAAVVFFLRPRTAPPPTDATAAPPVAYRLAWAYDPPARAIEPIGLDQQFGPLILIALAHPGDGRARGAVYALDRTTGLPRWTFDAGGTLAPTPVAPSGAAVSFVADGPGGRGRLFALRDADGAVQWELATADRVTAPPGAGDLHQAAVPAGDDGVYLVDHRTGQVVWHHPGGHVNTRPTGDGRRLYVATGGSAKYPDAELRALNPETGEVAWRVPLPGPAAGGDVWAGQGMVIVPLTTGLACFDSGSGARRWQLPEAGPTVLEARLLMLTGSTGTRHWAFVGTGDGFVRAVDVAAGRVEWSAAVGSPVVGPPALAGQYVFAATRDGWLFQLDQQTGAGVGRFDGSALLGGNAAVLAGKPGPRAVLIAEADTPRGRSIRVVCLEHVEWFTPR